MNNGTGTTAQMVKLELSLDEVNVVLAGLGELPAKTSLAVIDKVRSQAVGQLKAAEGAVPTAETVEGEVVN